MGYLSFWLAGKLHCFDGQGHAWALLVSAGPACIALWIGITRLEVCHYVAFTACTGDPPSTEPVIRCCEGGCHSLAMYPSTFHI